MIRYKQINVDSNDNGSIEGYASTWIREPDAYGDVVRKGAFTKSLERIKAEGKQIPLIWQHKLDDLKSYIGTAVADEDERGLHFIATFDSSEDAQKVRQMYLDGRLSKFSFAYSVIDEASITLEDGRKANELRELDIYEISAVLVPANDDAGVIDVKSLTEDVKDDIQSIKNVIEVLQRLIEDRNVELDDDNSNNSESTENDIDGNAGQAKDLDIINAKREYLLSIIRLYS